MEDAMSRVVSDNQSNIVSISLGACESDFQGPGFLTGLENEFQAAAALGQSVFVSSGDNGAYTPCSIPTNTPVVSYPASSAFVTAVGGTSLSTNPNSTYASETAWGSSNGCSDGTKPIPCGSGEGLSQDIAEPSWQSAAPIMSTGGHRGVADVSWNADPQTGYYLYLIGSGCNGLCPGWGGTSIAAPQWAGLAAIADQAAGKRLGLFGPLLYGNSVLSQQSSAFCAPYHDVTVPSTPQQLSAPLLFPAGAGWDLPTGWGSPNAYRLLKAIIPTVPVGLTPSGVQSPALLLPGARLGTVTVFRVALPLIFQTFGC
jgi:pseudomonalisin